MKKSLIALAVLATSGASFAQSSVTLYGVADVFLGSVKNTDALGASLTQTVLDAGGVSHNRWGLKGSEDLGGGLKANFNFEQGFSMDKGAADAAGQMFNRYAWVGLSGNFGEVKLGKTGTAYDDVNGAANAVFDSGLSPANYVFASTGYTWTPANSIMYVTPTFGGFNGEISYALDEKTAGVPAVTSVNVAYAGKVDYNTAGVGNVTEYQIGADYPVSAALTLSASYAESKTAAVGATAEVKKTGLGLGASYALSKRTSVYGGYETDKTKSTSIEHTLFAVGVRHAF